MVAAIVGLAEPGARGRLRAPCTIPLHVTKMWKNIPYATCGHRGSPIIKCAIVHMKTYNRES